MLDGQSERSARGRRQSGFAWGTRRRNGRGTHYALLGVVSHHPDGVHGYALKRQCERVLGHFWQVFVEHGARFPAEARGLAPRWADISRALRKDRALAFYGSEDVTPSTFYTRADGERALAMAEEVLVGVEPLVR